MIEPLDLEYFIQIADLAYVSTFHLSRLTSQLRVAHPPNGCDCQEKAVLDKRFSRLKSTLIESKIIESHTSYGGDILILIRNETMIIAYRGTQVSSIADLRADFATCLTPASTLTYHYQTPRLHGGFYRQYQGLQPFIQACIDKYAPKVLYNVGHSLGGALATIASLDISMRMQYTEPEMKLLCITFGSPKVGDQVFVNHFNFFMTVGTSFRVANPKDIIIHFPFLNNEFKHVNGLNHKNFPRSRRRRRYLYKTLNFVKELISGFSHHHLSSYMHHISSANNNQL